MWCERQYLSRVVHMADSLLIPSIETRLQGLIEVSRRNRQEHGVSREGTLRPTVTLTREFGCEGYIVAEKLQAILARRSGSPWVIMDRALLEAVARDNDLSSQVLENIGARNRFLDEMLSTLSPRWKSDTDYYRMLCRQIVALAQGGNVILVGRGAAILTQQMPNCYHFRIVAPMIFKVKSIAERTNLKPDEAREMIHGRQRQRDAFLKDFLGRDIADPTLYHLLFNNARCPASQIAALMAAVVLPVEGN
jgi:cytidylate kinase